MTLSNNVRIAAYTLFMIVILVRVVWIDQHKTVQPHEPPHASLAEYLFNMPAGDVDKAIAQFLPPYHIFCCCSR